MAFITACSKKEVNLPAERHIRVITALLFCCCSFFGEVLAEESPAVFEIESVNYQVDDEVLNSSVVFGIKLPRYIIEAIESGFDLPVSIEFQVLEYRFWWFNRNLVRKERLYILSYNVLLDQYSVTDSQLGLNRHFSTLEDAVSQLTVLLNEPLVSNSEIQDGSFIARVRIGIDEESLPIPLKSSSFWNREWSLSSGWVEKELGE